MSYLIKQVASPESGKINKGVFAIDLEGTTASGMVSGITPPSGSVVIVKEGASNDPDFWIIKRGSDLVNFGIYTLGLNGNSTENDVLDYIGQQSNYIVLDSLSGAGLLDSSLVTHLDASVGLSFPKAGGYWYDLTGDVNAIFTLSNGPGIGEGYFIFDGVNDHARTNNPNLDLANLDAYTLDFLVKIPHNGGNQPILFNGNTADNGIWFFKHRSGLGNRLVTHGYAAGQPRIDVITDNQVPDDVWTRCSLTHEGGTYQLYLNGLPDGPPVEAYPIDPHGGSTYIGRQQSVYLSGNIAEGRVYSRRLEIDELLKNYYQSNIVLNNISYKWDASNLVSYPGSGTITYNLAGNISGSLINGVTPKPDFGGYWEFDGAGDHIILEGTTDSFRLNQGAVWTVNAWVKTTQVGSTTGDAAILSNSNSGPVWAVFKVHDGKIAYSHYNNAWITTTGTIDINDDRWHLLTWVNLGNGKMNLYVDGLIDSTEVDGALSSASRIDAIGRSWSGYFEGSIADVQINTTAFTSTQVQQQYNASRYKFEHRLGSPALPASSAQAILNAHPDATDGIYWIKPNNYTGEPFPVYCDMTTNSGGWMHVGTVYDGNEGHTDTAAHPWSQLNPTQDTGIWEDDSTLNGSHPLFNKDYKNKAWSTAPFTQILLKDSGATQRNLLYTNSGQITSNNTSLSTWFGSLEWLTNGSETSTSAVTNGRVTALDITNFGVNDPIIESGAKSKLLFKFGERDGAQDANKDRSMIAWHRHDQGDNVDAPAGIGNFTNRSGNIDFRDIQPYAQRSDFPDNSITGAPYSVSIWIR